MRSLHSSAIMLSAIPPCTVPKLSTSCGASGKISAYSAGRRAAMAADAADGYAERHDALVRMRYAPRGRLADPRQPRDWCLAKDLLESRCDQMSALAAHLLTRSEHEHQRSLQTRRIESARRVQAFRYKALHVGGAAAVDSPIGDLELERIALPSRLPVEGDDVHVSGNYQAVGARRSNPRDQVGLRDAEQLDRLKRGFESLRREFPCDVFHRVAIALCADGVERDEPPRDIIQIIIHGGTGAKNSQKNRIIDTSITNRHLITCRKYSRICRRRVRIGN